MAKFFLVLFVLMAEVSSYAYEIVVENAKTKHLGYGEWLIDKDGELDLMQQLIRPGDIVFDVGANVGEWSLFALQLNIPIQLYAFEPLPLVFSDMQAHLSHYPHAQVFNLALSDKVGKGQFCHYDETYEFSALSSFYVREVLKADHQPPKIIEVTQDTLSHFCSEHNVDHIDFLKIDAEGAEWIILKGASDLIEQNKITAIQFEYGGCYVDAKTTLQETFDFLSKHDYAIFRIMPQGLIHIPEWDPSLENFDLSNYLAIKKEAASSRLGQQ